MKIKDLRQLGEADLDKKLSEIQKELIKISGQVSTGQGNKNIGQAKVLKKTIAKIKTIQNEKKIAK